MIRIRTLVPILLVVLSVLIAAGFAKPRDDSYRIDLSDSRLMEQYIRDSGHPVLPDWWSADGIKRGRHERACESWAQAVQINPQNVTPHKIILIDDSGRNNVFLEWTCLTSEPVPDIVAEGFCWDLKRDVQHNSRVKPVITCGPQRKFIWDR
ncbi:MAG: hypothetical protein OEZ59_10340 [Deltaproteobacteria bacterium]|nr:hypothetical protein [Deltaproteobacteria bacterium]